MRRFLFLGFALLSFTLTAQTTKTLPSITLKNLKGEQVSIADATKGKLTVISFWATWCVPCKKELNNISEMYKDWQKLYNVQLIAVSIDDSRNTQKVKAYVDGVKWDYSVLLDENQDLRHALNFQNVPYLIIVDKNGNIRYNHNSYVEGDEYEVQDQLKALATEK